MDAYVTCGLDKGNNAHVWVTTIDPNESITLWDPISGSRYKRPLYAELGLKKKGSDNNSNNNKSNTANSNSNTKTNVSSHSFRTVGCCFNDKSFYANCQVSDAVDYTDFDFSKPDDWKPISRDAIASIKRLGRQRVIMFERRRILKNISIDLANQPPIFPQITNLPEFPLPAASIRR